GCEDLAQAIAVVLATWISDVHPEYVGALPEPEKPLAPPATSPPSPAAAAEAKGAAPTTDDRTPFPHDITPSSEPASQEVARRFELDVIVGAAVPQTAAATSFLTT